MAINTLENSWAGSDREACHECGHNVDHAEWCTTGRMADEPLGCLMNQMLTNSPEEVDRVDVYSATGVLLASRSKEKK